MTSPENEYELSQQVTFARKVRGRFLSGVISLIFMGTVLVANAAENYIFWRLSEAYINDALKQHYLRIAFGCLSGFQIKCVDLVWDRLSDRVTDLEYRRCEAEFNKSKSAKTTVVRFINMLGGIVFFAFFHPIQAILGCPSTSNTLTCLAGDRSLLRYEMTCIFLTRFILLGTFNDIIKPYIALRRASNRSSHPNGFPRRLSGDGEVGIDRLALPVWAERPGHALGSLTSHELDVQTLRPRFGVSELTNDYIGAVLPLSFIVFFSMIGPSSVFVFCFMAMVVVRTNAWKLCNVFRRPYPRFAYGIGNFGRVLHCCIYGMVASNFGLMNLQLGGISVVLDRLGIGGALAAYLPSAEKMEPWLLNIFVSLVWSIVLILGWHMINTMVSDFSGRAKLEARRHNVQRQRVFHREARPKKDASTPMCGRSRCPRLRDRAPWAACLV